jgi:serine/threonine protein kinase
MASFHFLSRVISGDSHSVDVQLNEGSNEKLLGNGSFGAVFKREYKGISLAIKQFFEILDQQEKSFLREVSLLSQYFHPKIILLYGVNFDSEATKLVYPLMEGGDLHHLLHMSDVIFSYHQNISMCIDLAEAVHYLHSQNVIHRDLKPLNILLEKKILSNKDPISLKLADFGLSRHVNAQMTERVGTVHWNSPEVLSGHDYTIKSDIFSLGLVFWEIFTRDIPFSDLNNDQDPFHKNINVEIINGRIPDVERIECGEKSSLIQDLVINCLSFNPEHRPSAEQVLEILMGMIEDN